MIPSPPQDYKDDLIVFLRTTPQLDKAKIGMRECVCSCFHVLCAGGEYDTLYQVVVAPLPPPLVRG